MSRNSTPGSLLQGPPSTSALFGQSPSSDHTNQQSSSRTHTRHSADFCQVTGETAFRCQGNAMSWGRVGILTALLPPCYVSPKSFSVRARKSHRLAVRTKRNNVGHAESQSEESRGTRGAPFHPPHHTNEEAEVRGQKSPSQGWQASPNLRPRGGHQRRFCHGTGKT